MRSRAAAGERLPRGSLPALGALIIVAAAVAWNLVHLHAETLRVTYLDDAAMHEQMVRFATARFRQGAMPLTSWYPYLNLGSPHFIHYQSLPAMVTGAVGLLVGPNTAFRWSLYLLLSLWPISVYLSARVLGLSRWASAIAAAASPFLMSPKGTGYEQRAYIWIGFGLWTQLWASSLLPFAWAFSWRAIRDGRHRAAAAAAVALTVALHYETGYLALLGLPIFALVARAPWAARLRRLIAVGAVAFLGAAWVIVPVLQGAPWAAVNEPLRGSPLENGYGAGPVLSWLVSGQLLDFGRLPVVSVAAAVGLLVLLVRARREDLPRALLLLFVVASLLSFGRTTFGSLIAVVPGSTDLFFRRFMMGMQLTALWGAGIGGAWVIGAVEAAVLWVVARVPGRRARWRLLGRSGVPPRPAWRPGGRGGERRYGGRGGEWRYGGRGGERRRPHGSARPRRTGIGRLAGWRWIAWAGALVVALLPASSQVATLDANNRSDIVAQRTADVHLGPSLDRLLAVAVRDGPGRVYAGGPTNWGMTFQLGQVQVYKYLAARDIDEVGFALRTASLMSGPEYYMTDPTPAGIRLMGIRYLILAREQRPTVPAQRLTAAGPFVLWRTGVRGLFAAGAVVGSIAETRADVGTRSIPLLESVLTSQGGYLAVRWGGRRAGAHPVYRLTHDVTPGRVLTEHDDLGNGTATATVRMRRAGVVVLSASYDPGWQVRVSGHRRRVVMVAPALPAVRVPAGTSTVTFRFHAVSPSTLLLAVSALCLLGFAAWTSLRGWRGDGGAG